MNNQEKRVFSQLIIKNEFYNTNPLVKVVSGRSNNYDLLQEQCIGKLYTLFDKPFEKWTNNL